MKKIYSVICMVMLTTTAAWSQINEKDTVIESTFSKNGSVYLQLDILPDYIELNWSKGQDDHIAYYELYRSADGMAYTMVRQFHPQSFDASDNFFSYRDEDPLRGRNYYRLTAYEKGSGERRNVEAIAEYKNLPRKIQPSLVIKGSQLNIQNYDGEEMQLLLYNSAGTLLVRRVVNSTVVNLPEHSARGAYIYQLVDRRQIVVASGKLILQ